MSDDREVLLSADAQENVRWAGETANAATHLGWSVVETTGIDDYQGWGVHLLKRGDAWGVLAWSYGSCSGCDDYEDEFCSYHWKTYRPGEMPGDFNEPSHHARVFGELIETCASEVDARALFDTRKGW